VDDNHWLHFLQNCWKLLSSCDYGFCHKTWWYRLFLKSNFVLEYPLYPNFGSQLWTFANQFLNARLQVQRVHGLPREWWQRRAKTRWDWESFGEQSEFASGAGAYMHNTSMLL
jgi:hypothetical protein